ncbi:diguanylate cyclase domain-containing protein [Deinococcus cellulosilyticus]|uniref:Uncharacterized protein n=1 Tax=Deinococcus cellulosilyticus (strain DSM 18568 / NBRC 106333 / KACC 11606 / 5516J-15) TaxID=1223518 RepID=A0A511MW14_DEIC1|nr:diguanylate cyclase [Deinococcus cellulosilyticus]GEM44367.1 hypothetical protein DC3_00020 [Deinococcus cellulosilyticus NBRC 106333 = KACC 11606]
MTPEHLPSSVLLLHQSLRESLKDLVVPDFSSAMTTPAALFAQVFDALPAAVAVLCAAGKVAYLNPVLLAQQAGTVQHFHDLNLSGFNWHTVSLPPQSGFHSMHLGETVARQPADHHLRLEQLFSAMTDIIMVFDQDGRHLDIAPTNPDLLYRPARDQIGRTMFEVFDAEFAGFFTEKIQNCLETGQKIEFEYDLTLHQRKTFFAASLTPLDDSTVMLIARDVTQQKTAERALRDSERRLGKLLKRSPVAIALLDPQGTVLQVNDRFTRTYGYTAEDIGHIDHWWEVAYPDPAYRQKVQQQWLETNQRAFRAFHKETAPEEYWITTRSGEVRITEITAAYLGDTMMVVFNDITERRHAEMELQDNQSRLSGIIESAMDAIITIDEKHHIRLFNRAAEQIFHCAATEVIGKSLDRFIPEGARLAHLEHVQRFQQSGTSSRSMHSQVPLEGVRADGEVFPLEASISQTTVHGETLFTVILRDITERKRAEQERQERLVHMEVLNAVSRDLSELNWDSLKSLGRVATHISRHIGEVCAIHLVQEDRLELQALHPERKDIYQQMQQIHESLGQSGSEDSLLAFRFATRRELSTPDADQALLMVPLQIQGKLLGTLTLLRGTEEYTAQEQALVQNIADRVALTYRNAQLYQDNLKQAQRLREVNALLEDRIQERTLALQEANQLLQKQALEDGLTGLANRRHFNQVLSAEVRRACRKREHLSLLLCDVDFFKRYNDHYGHLMGDQALQELARVLKSTFQRAGDCCARFGGEEFAVILPHTTAEQAQVMAERLLQNVRDLQLEHLESLIGPMLTISMGVVSAQITLDITPEMLVHLADEALYESKDSGRNRATHKTLELHPDEEKTPS